MKNQNISATFFLLSLLTGCGGSSGSDQESTKVNYCSVIDFNEIPTGRIAKATISNNNTFLVLKNNEHELYDVNNQKKVRCDSLIESIEPNKNDGVFVFTNDRFFQYHDGSFSSYKKYERYSISNGEVIFSENEKLNIFDGNETISFGVGNPVEGAHNQYLSWKTDNKELQITNKNGETFNFETPYESIESVSIPTINDSQLVINKEISNIRYIPSSKSFIDNNYEKDYQITDLIFTPSGYLSEDGTLYNIGLQEIKVVDKVSVSSLEFISSNKNGDILFLEGDSYFLRSKNGEIYKLDNYNFNLQSKLEDLSSTIRKFPYPYTSAISLTDDTGCIDCDSEYRNRNYLENYGIGIDYEIVTYDFDRKPSKVEVLLNDVIGHGHSFYGHGHQHINHDSLSYEDALASFKTSKASLESYGLTPVAYAYPGGKGIEKETQLALQKSGFYSGRSFNMRDYPYNDLFLYKSKSEFDHPWLLPIIRFENQSSTGCNTCVDTDEELIKYTKQNREYESWMIFVFHSIGWKEGWGYTERKFFEHTIDHLVSEGDIWVASMNEVTKQIYQHKYTTFYKRGEQKFIDDGLFDKVFDRTLEFN
ncbi:polysaccharide deacetylase family protein [Ferrimonas aestuarii]|uniref:Polysaccharide deacetylase n=1 Tax=Ferrimonas aestuarii TaxID=2569539 RepID=A0A4U1BPB4_9GAMM|nr:polysaccharide deacetylase family protein [Ferrimonas aestuarii]TKB56038.1 hypothetical protein FCL42_07415 [Ferrimonas aestuarii]